MISLSLERGFARLKWLMELSKTAHMPGNIEMGR